MKYKLINSVTKKETICDKIVVNGFDYYVSDETVENYCWYINTYTNKLYHSSTLKPNENSKKVIATNNPNIDIPKVVDEVEKLASDVVNNNPSLITDREKISCFADWIDGYLKSQETHPFTEEDMIEFAEFTEGNFRRFQEGLWRRMTSDPEVLPKNFASITTKELLQLWKEQRLKTIYYE